MANGYYGMEEDPHRFDDEFDRGDTYYEYNVMLGIENPDKTITAVYSKDMLANQDELEDFEKFIDKNYVTMDDVEELLKHNYKSLGPIGQSDIDDSDNDPFNFKNRRQFLTYSSAEHLFLYGDWGWETLR